MADVTSPARKNRERLATQSFDNVTDFATTFSPTHTFSSMVEIPLPEQFVAHKGCKRNMSYDELRDEVMSRDEGRLVENDVVNVDTGKFTGRCPKDRYVVDSGAAHDNVDWGAVNIPIAEATFDKVFISPQPFTPNPKPRAPNHKPKRQTTNPKPCPLNANLHPVNHKPHTPHPQPQTPTPAPKTQHPEK